MMPHVTQHFTIHVGTMSIGKHSDADSLQTANCYGLQMWIIVQTLWTDADQILGSAHLCWTGHDAGMGTAFTAYMSSLAGHPWSRRRRRQLDQRASWVGKVQTKQVGRRQLLWLTRHWSSCCNVICMCWRWCGAAAKSLGLRAETVTVWPSRSSQINHTTNTVMVVL